MLALLTGGFVGACTVWGNRDFFHDDAYIMLRYCWHWLHTGEIVWNPGERVEGFTNPLHLVLSTALGALGVPWTRAPQLINLLAVMGIACLLLWRLRARVSRNGALLGVTALLSSGPLWTWVMGGLEGPLAAALLGAGTLLLLDALEAERPDRLAVVGGALLGLSVLARPELLTVGAVALLGWALQRPAQRRVALKAGVAWSVPFVLYGVWRWVYFGELLPNTYYAKLDVPTVDLGVGGRYVVDFFAESPIWALLALLTVYVLVADRARRGIGWMVVGMVLAHVLFVVRAGGDHMPASRLMVPLLPLLSVALAVSVTSLETRLPSRWTVPVLSLMVSLCALEALDGLDHRPRDPAAFVGEIVGRWMQRNIPRGQLVALHTAGSTPFLNPQLRFVDMLGLTDKHIARRRIDRVWLPMQRLPGHAKGDGAYILSRRPDVIVLGEAEGGHPNFPVFLSDYELARSAEFRRCYVGRQTLIPYDRVTAARGPRRPNPLRFTWWVRVCRDG